MIIVLKGECLFTNWSAKANLQTDAPMLIYKLLHQDWFSNWCTSGNFQTFLLRLIYNLIWQGLFTNIISQGLLDFGFSIKLYIIVIKLNLFICWQTFDLCQNKTTEKKWKRHAFLLDMSSNTHDTLKA